MAKLASIILAAGASSRFGPENKLLTAIDGRPLVRRVVEAVRDGAGGDIVVVTGAEEREIADALQGLDVRLVANAGWRRGLGSSIATGVAALRLDTDGAFIVPGDMPFLQPDLLRTLIAAFARAGGRAVVYPATRAGAQRNPVLWPRRFFSELMSLGGTGGAKHLLQSVNDEAIAVPFTDDMLFADIDTPADLEAARSLAAEAVPLARTAVLAR